MSGRVRLRRRQVAAIAAGNALEFYDFVTYAIFAAPIGRAFFPSSDPGLSLLASLATFGAGFAARPLGAAAIGRWGDRRGRRPAMLLALVLIGVSVAGLALTPSYAAIGRTAPVLAIGFRLLGGFALGGEVGPSTALLLESAPPARRGLYVSVQAMSADGAVLAAGAVGVGLSDALGPAALDTWGWRLALLLGLAIVPFALAARRTLAETMEAEDALAPAPGAPPPRAGRAAALGLLMLAGATVSNYVLVYLGTYASTTLGVAQRSAFASTVLVGLGGVLCDPLSGWLSDRWGRKPVMIAPAFALLLLVLPAFRLLAAHRTPGTLYAVGAVLSGVLDLSTGTILVAVAEALPRARRSGGFGLVYALAISGFGGGTPFVLAWAVRASGDPLAPAYLMAAALLLALLAMALMPETAPGRRRVPSP